MKKILSWFIVFVILVVTFGFLKSDTAVMAATNKGTDGQISWEIDGDTLTIGAVEGTEGMMNAYTYTNSAPWLSAKGIKKVKNVVINDGVTRLGALAFDMDGLTINRFIIAGTVTRIPNYFCRKIRIDSLYLCEGTNYVDNSAFYCSVGEVFIPQSVSNVALSSFGINNAEGKGTISYLSRVYGYTNGVGDAFVSDYLKAIEATNSSVKAWTDCRQYALDSNMDGENDRNPKLEFVALDKSSIFKGTKVTNNLTVSVKKSTKIKVQTVKPVCIVSKYSGLEGEAKVTFKSNNKKIATVNSKGQVTGLKKGKTKVSTTIKFNNGLKKTYYTTVVVK